MALKYLNQGGGLCLSFVTLLALAILAQTGTVSGEDCIRCVDFNKGPKTGVSCAQKYEDCGPCLSGFIPDELDPRQCIALEILESSEPHIKNLSDEVYLPCKFNAPIQCMWKKDGAVLDISSNKDYKWSNDGNGENTDDCSINIKSLKPTQVGKYQCMNKGTSELESIKSEEITVSTPPKITEASSGVKNVTEGQLFTLACKFDNEFKCSWIRNGRPVASKGNYQFQDKLPTKDCTLTINKFTKANDEGEWKCLVPGTSESEAVSSNITKLNGIKAPSTNNQSPPAPPAQPPPKPKPQLQPGSQSQTGYEPAIFLKWQEVSSKVLTFPSKTTDPKLLMDLTCRAGANGHLKSIVWFVHHEIEHEGGLSIDDREITASQDLASSIVNILQREPSTELWCMVEYTNGQTHSATVTIQRRAVEVAGYTTSLPPMMIGIAVVMVFLIVFILAIVGFLVWRYRNRLFTPYSPVSLGSSKETLDPPEV